MKLHQESRDVVSIGAGAESTFKIKAGAKAFKILSDGLYSNKVQAVVRELSTNAYDAHIAAGNESPFEVHLPNAIEPWFAVKDFGTGLSHKDVMNLYTTYFESTKTDCNDQVGALGLGSKSPFSVSKEFLVESRIDGKRMQYTCYLNEEMTPAIRLMAEGETDEPNGLTVQVPVKEDDMRSFKNEALTVFKYFPQLPTIIGLDEEFELEEREVVLEGKGWRIIKAGGNRYGHHRTRSVAVQGVVAYPLKADQLKIDYYNSKNPNDKLISALIDCNIEIDFKVGDISITPSREELSYDEPTIANIKVRLEEVIEELKVEMEAKMSSAKTLWEAKMFYATLFAGGSPVSRLSGHFELNWKGEKITGSDFVLEFKDDIAQCGMVQFKESYRSSNIRASKHNSFSLHLTASEKIVMVFDDIGRGSHQRIKHAIKEGELDEKKVFMFNDKEKAIVKALGGIKLRKASEFPKPPVAKRTGPDKDWFLMQYDGYTAVSYRDEKKHTWEAVKNEDIPARGYFVWTSRCKPVHEFETKNDLVPLSSVISLLNKSGLMTIADEQVYGLARRCERGLKDGAWTNIIDHAVKLVKDEMAKPESKVALARYNAFSEDKAGELFGGGRNWESVREVAKVLGAKHPISLYINEVMEVRALGDKIQALNTLAKKLRVTVEDVGTKVTFDFKMEKDRIEGKYPLIKAIDGYRAGAFKDAIVQYVMAMDNA